MFNTNQPMYRPFAGAIMALMMVLTAMPISAQEPDSEFLIDSLGVELSNAVTSADSVRILYDILDLSQALDRRAEIAAKLYRSATNAGDTLAQVEAIMYRANCKQTDTLALDSLTALLDEQRRSPRADEIRLMIELFRTENVIRTDTSSSKSESLSQLIERLNSNPPDDGSERVRMLFSVCTHLATSTQGSLLEKFSNELLTAVRSANFPVGAVRNLIYTRAAPVFTNNDNPEAAVAIDKEILNIIDSLSIAYADRGRKYRSLDRNRYQCFRRMLANYKVLTPAEIHQYYHAILDIAQRNPAVKADLENNYRTKVYYNMAIKNYPVAIDAIEEGLVVETRDNYRFYLLNALLEAGDALSDGAISLRALRELNTILRKEINSKAQERYRELQIIYDVSALRAENAELEAGKLQARNKANRHIFIVSGIAVLLLLGMIVILWRQNGKMRRLAKRLRDTADHLRDERNELRDTQKELIEARDKAKSADNLKTEFINTMSHEMKTPLAAIAEYSRVIVDCIPNEKRNYLERFANIIELSTNMVQTLLNDVLDLGSLENDTMSIKKEPAEIYNLCRCAIDSVFDKSNTEGNRIKVIFNPENRPDAVVIIDEQRVAQVLINLLSNARKFTERGSVTLDFKLDAEARKLTFSVSDTGPGIPEGKEEAVFGRFEKLDSASEGSGLGLYISKLIARLLGGTLEVDRDYDRGARFVFTIPL